MHIGLFGEATSRVGAGHAMRLVAIGQAAEDQGHRVSYLGPGIDIPWVEQLFRGWTQTVEASAVIDWIIVDSYDSDVLDAASRVGSGSRLACIVDAVTPHIPADLFVAPGVLDSERQPNVSASAELVAGVPQLLIRRDIWHRAYSPRDENPFVLVTLGGTAGELDTHLVVSSLRAAGWHGRVIALTLEARSWDDVDLMTEVRPTGPTLVDLAQGCMFAVSAAGVTAWELLSMGVPLGLVCLSSDQVCNYEWVTNHGAAVALGRLDEGASVGVETLRSALSSPSRRRNLSTRGRDLVDGKGAQRLVDLMARYVE